MRKILIHLFLVISVNGWSQTDSVKWVRAFPITSYIMNMNDSTKLVQLYLPAGPSIGEKQACVLRGVYRNDHSDTMILGTGRRVLNKGQYYYFTIDWKKDRAAPKENDLLYIPVNRPVTYVAQILRLASHFITFQNVLGNDLFDRFSVFQRWSYSNEDALLDSMVRDIHYTGNYFLKNSPTTDVKIIGGKYDGKMIYATMIACTLEDLSNFLDYMIARPRLYAGRQWKIAEIFATWLTYGSPLVNHTGR